MKRKDQILESALEIAGEPGGWTSLTRQKVAERASCSEGLVSAHFGTMIAFRRSILRAAEHQENLSIVAQAYTSNHPYVSRIPQELIKRAMVTYSNV